MDLRQILIMSPLLLAVAACGRAAPSGSPGEAGRTDAAMRDLVILLDGVPFEVVDSLWVAGHFRGFRQPSAVISPFPSLTNVAFDAVWGEAPAGYEDRWYDPSSNRVRGGLLEHILHGGEAGPSFHEHIEVSTDPVSASLAYLFPKPMAELELRRLRDEVVARAGRDSIVVAYLVATDALGHRAGREGLVAQLLDVERFLAEVGRRYGPRVRISLFSDHGNDLLPTRRVDLERALEAAGLRSVERLERPGDVVAIRFGLVGAAALHTRPEDERRVAEAVAGVAGVDLVLFEETDGPIHVWRGAQRALVRHDPRTGGFAYTATDGDPLGLAAAAARLREHGRADARGFAPDSAWLEASLETPYIDALRRVVVSMRAGVRHPADVALSFEPGYHFGDRAADFLVDVTGTHGSLRTTASMAFFMSTRYEAPPLLRGDDLRRYLPALR